MDNRKKTVTSSTCSGTVTEVSGIPVVGVGVGLAQSDWHRELVDDAQVLLLVQQLHDEGYCDLFSHSTEPI